MKYFHNSRKIITKGDNVRWVENELADRKPPIAPGNMTRKRQIKYKKTNKKENMI